MEMIFSWLKYRSSFISRKVRRQNIEWSNGMIFLIATFWPEGLWIAELELKFTLVCCLLLHIDRLGRQIKHTRQHRRHPHQWCRQFHIARKCWRRSSSSLPGPYCWDVAKCSGGVAERREQCRSAANRVERYERRGFCQSKGSFLSSQQDELSKEWERQAACWW